MDVCVGEVVVRVGMFVWRGGGDDGDVCVERWW